MNHVTVVTCGAGILHGVFKRYDEDCTTLATNKKTVHYSSAPTALASKSSESGWDPFEVWRTRVLLPRLAEAREEKATTPVPLVRRTPVVE